MDSDWKHLLRTENSQKPLLKNLYYNNKGTAKVLRRHFSVLESRVWSKIFTDWFKKCSDRYIFSNTIIHRIGYATSILCPRYKKLFKCNLVSTATAMGSKETFLKICNPLLNIYGNLIIQFNQFSKGLLHNLLYWSVVLIKIPHLIPIIDSKALSILKHSL